MTTKVADEGAKKKDGPEKGSGGGDAFMTERTDYSAGGGMRTATNSVTFEEAEEATAKADGTIAQSSNNQIETGYGGPPELSGVSKAYDLDWKGCLDDNEKVMRQNNDGTMMCNTAFDSSRSSTSAASAAPVAMRSSASCTKALARRALGIYRPPTVTKFPKERDKVVQKGSKVLPSPVAMKADRRFKKKAALGSAPADFDASIVGHPSEVVKGTDTRRAKVLARPELVPAGFDASNMYAEMDVPPFKAQREEQIGPDHIHGQHDVAADDSIVPPIAPMDAPCVFGPADTSGNNEMHPVDRQMHGAFPVSGPAFVEEEVQEQRSWASVGEGTEDEQESALSFECFLAEETTRPAPTMPQLNENECVYDGVSLPANEGGGKGEAATGGMAKKLRYALLALLFCTVVGIAVALGLTLGPGPTAPTAAPATTTARDPERYAAIEAVLRAHCLNESTAQALEEEESPQRRALIWLAEEDGRRLDPRNEKDLVQRFALAVFYFSTRGDEWKDRLGFLSDAHECDWKVRVDEQLEDGSQRVHASPGFVYDFLGVECRRDNLTVDTIRIYGNNLAGTLPLEIGALTALEYLSLWSNKLTDGIPTTLGSLAELQALYLHMNTFNKSIPTELGRLLNLRDLGLSGNDITGQVPEELNALSMLEWADFSDNALAGSVPFIGMQMSSNKLKHLISERNFHTGMIAPHDIADKFPLLSDLCISVNELNGTIPKEIFDLKSLRTLKLSFNQVSGTLPSEIGKATSLRHLEIRNAALTGSIPKEIGSLVGLTMVYFTANQLTGVLPREIGKLQHLVMLSVMFNRISGTLPPEMGNMTDLVRLHLDVNKFSGTVPVTLSALENLDLISFSNNSLTGDVSFLCDNDYIWFSADCYGDNPEVSCECCNACCSDLVQGPINGWDQLIQPILPHAIPPPEAEHWNCFFMQRAK